MSELKDLEEQRDKVVAELAHINEQIGKKRFEKISGVIKNGKYYKVSVGTHKYLFFKGCNTQLDNFVLKDVVSVELFPAYVIYRLQTEMLISPTFDLSNWVIEEITKKKYIEELHKTVKRMDMILEKETKND